MPYGDVNVIGSPGDKIEWRTPGSSNLPAINFLGATPCGPISNPCTIKSNIGNGIYLYGCSGNASCPDPGVGPISTTAPLTLFGKFLKVFDAVVVDIAHSLDFFEASGFRMVLSSTNGSSNEAAKPAVARPAYRTSAEITCSGNTTIAPTVQVNSNGSILWASSNDNFTIAIVADKPICRESFNSEYMAAMYPDRCSFRTKLPLYSDRRYVLRVNTTLENHCAVTSKYLRVSNCAIKGACHVNTTEFAQAQALSMELVDGSTRRTVVIDRFPFVIGRSSDCNLALPQSYVSRSHAAITHDGARFVLEDAQTAGTERL